MKRLNITVKGLVQGVCFRYYTVDRAVKLGVKGWVRNKSDGSVEIVAEGGDVAVEGLKEWCLTGPPNAEVTEVVSEAGKYTGEFKDFDIVH